MNKFYAKVGAGVSGAVLMMGLFAASAFAADLTISGNGVGSQNAIVVADLSGCLVHQSSNTFVGAIVGSSASTGGNEASGNTGGDVTVKSGAASATSTVTVSGGNNTATNPCCCDQASQGPSAEIKDNGVGSKNAVVDINANFTAVGQDSNTGVMALVGAKAKTGKNKANGNTGSGKVKVVTGNSTSSSRLTVTGGSNSL